MPNRRSDTYDPAWMQRADVDDWSGGELSEPVHFNNGDYIVRLDGGDYKFRIYTLVNSASNDLTNKRAIAVWTLRTGWDTFGFALATGRLHIWRNRENIHGRIKQAALHLMAFFRFRDLWSQWAGMHPQFYEGEHADIHTITQDCVYCNRALATPHQIKEGWCAGCTATPLRHQMARNRERQFNVHQPDPYREIPVPQPLTYADVREVGFPTITRVTTTPPEPPPSPLRSRSRRPRRGARTHQGLPLSELDTGWIK